MGAYEYLRSDDTVVGKAGKAKPKAQKKKKNENKKKTIKYHTKEQRYSEGQRKKNCNALPCPALLHARLRSKPAHSVTPAKYRERGGGGAGGSNAEIKKRGTPRNSNINGTQKYSPASGAERCESTG